MGLGLQVQNEVTPFSSPVSEGGCTSSFARVRGASADSLRGCSLEVRCNHWSRNGSISCRDPCYTRNLDTKPKASKRILGNP